MATLSIQELLNLRPNASKIWEVDDDGEINDGEPMELDIVKSDIIELTERQFVAAPTVSKRAMKFNPSDIKSWLNPDYKINFPCLYKNYKATLEFLIAKENDVKKLQKEKQNLIASNQSKSQKNEHLQEQNNKLLEDLKRVTEEMNTLEHGLEQSNDDMREEPIITNSTDQIKETTIKQWKEYKETVFKDRILDLAYKKGKMNVIPYLRNKHQRIDSDMEKAKEVIKSFEKVMPLWELQKTAVKEIIEKVILSDKIEEIEQCKEYAYKDCINTLTDQMQKSKNSRKTSSKKKKIITTTVDDLKKENMEAAKNFNVYADYGVDQIVETFKNRVKTHDSINYDFNDDDDESIIPSYDNVVNNNAF